MLVLAALVVALIQWGKRPWLVGTALAFAFVIKYQTLIFLPYLIWRRQWRAVGWFLAAFFALAAAPALSTGWSENLENWQRAVWIVQDVASGAAADGERLLFSIDWRRSVSLTSTISRAVADFPNRDAATAAIVLLTATSLLLIAWRLYVRAGAALFRRAGDDGPATHHGNALLMDWAGLVTAMLVFSIQSIDRHFVVNALTVTIAAALVLQLAGSRQMWLAFAGIILFAVGTHLRPFAAGTPLATWLGFGSTSFGALALLFMTLWVWSSRMRPVETEDRTADDAWIVSTASPTPLSVQRR